MGNIITINPVTRISGFMEIQVVVENKRVTDAKCSGLMFRGFEKMLRGRPPLDAIYYTERICGICSTAHSMTSTLALEDTIKIKPDVNGRLIRDFMHGCEFIQNHIRHFYQYTIPDFVRGAGIDTTIEYSSKDYRLPEALNNSIAEHYQQSIKYSRLAHEMLAVLGGKAPHTHGIFVGGVTVELDSSKYIKIKSILSKIKEFVNSQMIPDIYSIAGYYDDYFEMGIGYKNLMSFGVFDYFKEKDIFYLDPAVYINNQLYYFNQKYITENILYSWYYADSVEQKPEDETVEDDISKENAYTWVKAPRYAGKPVEVGPLARMWLSGEYKRGISAMDRYIARVLEVGKIIGILEGILQRVALGPAKQDKYQFLGDIMGTGLIDTTRGALGHWIRLKDGKIFNYEIITPTAWNLSPMDSKGQKGIAEQALIGTTIRDIDNPVELGRIVRSFDPCISCATHITGDNHKTIKMSIV